jgi:hypothetical protein
VAQGVGPEFKKKKVICSILYMYLCVVLRLEHRALQMLSKWSVTQLHPQP